MGKLIKGDFEFVNAIPTTACWETLGMLYACPIKHWKTGKFSDSFKTLTSTPLGILNVVGIPPLDGGFYSCAGLLSSLTNWNSCVQANLNNLLKQHSDQVNLTDSSALLQSLKDKSTTDVTCSGALCVLLKPILAPVKWLLNGLGEAILSPLLTKVLGLNVNQSQVKALKINCDAAQLVY